MSRLMTGIMLVLGFMVIDFAVAFINSDAATGTQVTGCTTEANFTTCQEVSKSSFLSEVFSTPVHGIQDAPDPLNALYLLISTTLLVTGILLVVWSFVPLTNQ